MLSHEPPHNLFFSARLPYICHAFFLLWTFIPDANFMMFPVRSLLPLFLQPYATHAFVAFKSHCTLPPKTVQYVSNPDVRGTLQILWACLTVLILCTWSIQHLAVPLERDKSLRPSYIRRFGLLVFTGFAKLFGQETKSRSWNEFFDEVR